MHTFQDKHGKEWVIDLTLDKALAIESWNFAQALGAEPELGEDGTPRYSFQGIAFINPEDELFTKYITNAKICFDMVWCCVRDQAAKGNIENQLQFAERLDGKSLDDARMAFFQELPSFFPRRATTLRALITKYSAAEVATDQRMAKVIEDNLTEEAMARILDRAEKQSRQDFLQIIETLD